MAKGSIVVDVSANTDKAKQKIQALQKEVQGSQSLKSLGGGLKGLGLDGMGSQLSGLGDALGALGKFAGPAAGVGAIAVLAKGLGDMAERGQEAAKAAQSMEVQLTQLSRNFGGTGAGVKEVTRELQLMSANGVNSMESITSAMTTLTVVTKGNVVQASELVKSFDDLSAGTGVQIDQWAEMTAKVMNAGVGIKDLNKLSNRGIPIYQAFADVLGTTAEEAQKMAKAGQLSTEDWTKAVNQLAQSYKGLSAAMSSQTLEGAQSTYQAMRSMQMQPLAESRNQEMIDALNENSAKIEAELNDPVRVDQLKSMGALAGKIDWATTKIGEIVSDFSGSFAQAAFSVGERLTDWATIFTGNQKTKDVRLQSYASGQAFLPNLAGDDRNIASFIEGKTSGDVQGWLKETETALRNLTNLDLSEFSEESKRAVAAGIQRLTEQQANLSKALAEVQKVEAEKAAKDAADAQAEAARETGEKVAQEYQKTLLDEAKRSGDPEAILKAFFGEDLKGTVEEYLAGLEPLSRMLSQGLGDEEMLNRYKMLQEVQAAYNKQLEEEGKLKEKQAADIEKMKQDYKAGIIRDIANTQSELQSVNAKIEEQQMAAQEIADEEAHGIYRQKWGNLDVSTVKSESAALLKKQAELNDKLAGLDEKWRNSDQHIEDSIKAVNKFTNDLANRVISINAVVDPIRVG